MSRLHLFIDTNIFLNLYHYSDDDLEELKKIIVLLETNELVLYATNQLINEFKRNRDDKLKEALESIKKITTTTNFPNICKTYEEYSEITKSLKNFNLAKEKLSIKLLDDIINKELKADGIINQILQKSNILDFDEEIINKAKLRFDLGNPPWKKWSYWDAINWELLIKWITSSSVEEIEALHFITQDKDYVSSIDPNRFNSFLYDEWLNLKGFPIQYYWKLTDFFRKKFPDIKLATELHKSLLIQKFCDSWTFRGTKLSLYRLWLFSDFTQDELNKIIQWAVSNNQIYWISSQVKDALNAMINWRRSEIESGLLEEFDSIYNPNNEEIDSISIDDILF